MDEGCSVVAAAVLRQLLGIFLVDIISLAYDVERVDSGSTFAAKACKLFYDGKVKLIPQINDLD